MELPSPIELLVFMAAVLIVFMFVVTVSGHFPLEHRKPALRGPAGTAIILSSSALIAATALLGLALAYEAIPWYAAVIGGGIMILAAPYALHPWPDRIINGPRALLALGAAAAVVSGLMIGLMA